MCFFSNVLLFYYHYYFVSRHWANFGFLGNLACHSVSELWKENIKIHFQAFFYCTLCICLCRLQLQYIYLKSVFPKWFCSPLQQHLQTPDLAVLFLFIFWRLLLEGLFIYNLPDVYYCTFIGLCRFKFTHTFTGHFLLMSFISTSAALTYTTLSSFIPLYILKVITEGFVDI